MKKVIVIGSGIAGSATAYELAKRNVHVTLIDRNEIGQATQAAAGIISPWAAQRKNKDWYELVRLGAKMYPSLIQELASFSEQPSAYKKVGAIHLYNREDRLQAAFERVEKRKERAPEIGAITKLSSTETNQLLPFIQKDMYQALHIEGGARVDGRALQQMYLDAAKQLGTTVINGNAQLSITNDIVHGVVVGSTVIEADCVVAAAGAWMGELFTDNRVQFDVRPQKAQLIHLHVPDQATDDLPVIMPPNNQYMLPGENNRFIIGATHENDVGFDTRPTAGGMHEVLSEALAIAPGLAQSSVVETRVGLRPFCGNSLPVFGYFPHVQGLLGVNGLGASGLTMGPFIGRQLAKLITDESTDIELEPYHFNRILLASSAEQS